MFNFLIVWLICGAFGAMIEFRLTHNSSITFIQTIIALVMNTGLGFISLVSGLVKLSTYS